MFCMGPLRYGALPPQFGGSFTDCSSSTLNRQQYLHVRKRCSCFLIRLYHLNKCFPSNKAGLNLQGLKGSKADAVKSLVSFWVKKPIRSCLNRGVVNCLYATFVCLFSCLFLLSATSLYAKQWPVIGQDSIQADLLENHSQALVRWAEMDISNAVLINVDAHDDLRWIDPEKTEILQEISDRRDWKAFQSADSSGDQGLYHIGSFIYAAYHLGIVSEVYWIIPFTYFQSSDVTGELNRFLDGYGFEKHDIQTFVMNEGCYRGSHYGIPLTICDIHNLPHISDPVVLSIDADYLPPFADWNNQDILSSMSVLFSSLAQKKYSVQEAIVSTSVDGGYLSVSRRWIAEQCLDFLAQPERIHGPYPDIWLVRNLADVYYQNGQVEALLDLTCRFQRRLNSDYSLAIYRSFALLASGDEQGAFALANSIARTDRRYAYVLADLGQCLLDKGNLDKAIKYFEKAYRLHPDMNYRQKNLADELLIADRLNQALHYYERFQQKNGSFPTKFVMGHIWLRLGEEQKAATCFEAGLSGMQVEKYATVDNQIDVLAVREAARFFRSNNQKEKSKLIVSHPGLKHLFSSKK